MAVHEMSLVSNKTPLPSLNRINRQIEAQTHTYTFTIHTYIHTFKEKYDDLILIKQNITVWTQYGKDEKVKK